MNIRKYATMLAAALLLGTAILGTAAGQAEAKPKKPGPMVYCYVDNGNGDFDLYLPGTTIADGHGGFLTCGEDGNWNAVRIGGPTSNNTAPTTTGGGVLSQ